MKRFRLSFFAAFAAIVALLTSVSTASAMEFDQPFAEGEIPALRSVVFNGNPNLRVQPDPNATLITAIPRGSTGQVIREIGDRSLVRAKTPEGNYLFGWVNNDDANMQESDAIWMPEECSVAGGVRVQNTVMYGDFYIVDYMATQCNVLVECRTRLIERHEIYIGVDEGEVYADAINGVMLILEGSTWYYPSDWNMSDFSTEKLPIGGEFVTAKRLNMLDEGYDWEIVLYDVNGSPMTFAAGGDVPDFVPNEDEYAPNLEPVRIPVSGLYDDGSFVASIGSTATTTVALIDGELFVWQTAEDNIEYRSVEAWNIPSGWTMEQITDWAATQYPGETLTQLPGTESPEPAAFSKAPGNGGIKTA